MTADRKLSFSSDYMEGAHPEVLQRLVETNLEQTPGYGTDAYCESAREKIRAACACPDAEIHFLVGGTQANMVAIDTMIAPYAGVVAADPGHIATHEAGAIEAGGHKVMGLPHHLGKISADQVDAFARIYWDDANHEHMVMPGMVYLSQPTEYGTLYSRSELEAMREVCTRHGMQLYVDGARLAYALAAPGNDVGLADLARLCDAFYIGGTKCAALLGEAMVFPHPGTVPHFFTLVKQHGALLAKGRVLGVMFDTLFTDDLYGRVGAHAIEAAERIRAALAERGYEQFIATPTNQIFVAFDQEQLAQLSDKVEMGFWENLPDGRTVMRIATSWATRAEDVDALIELL